MKKGTISIILSIIAIITCIINFFVFNIRVAPYEFDVYGALVGILGILVTFLLGWQIFSVFQMKKEIDKLKKTYTKLEKLREDIKEHTNQMDNDIKNSGYILGFELYSTILADHYLKNSGRFSFFSEFKNLILCLLYANNVPSPLYEERAKPLVNTYLPLLIDFCINHRTQIDNLDDLAKERLLENIDIYTKENRNIDFSFLIATLKGTI
jgi:hypothetical protein